MKMIRVHISSLFRLAEAEGIDRYFKTPRGKVGGFESATLAAMGATGDVALLPMRGDRWPDAALRRAQQIACETYKSMLRPNA